MAGRPSTKKPPQFGQRLIELRKRRGFTQGEFAELLGVTPQALEYYEHRAKNPSLELLLKLADALDVSVGELIGETEERLARRRKPGPPSALEDRIERLRQLPRAQQETVIKMLDGLLGSASATP
jgi:transcriptional regulator with XRE-family HTH domain